MQGVLTAILVLAAALYLGRRLWRQFKARRACDLGCGCAQDIRARFPKHRSVRS